MPTHDANCPSVGQPIDRLSLAVSAPRGAAPSSNPSTGCYCSCACFADDVAPSAGGTLASLCGMCTCSADDVSPSAGGTLASLCGMCTCSADEV